MKYFLFWWFGVACGMYLYDGFGPDYIKIRPEFVIQSIDQQGIHAESLSEPGYVIKSPSGMVGDTLYLIHIQK